MFRNSFRLAAAAVLAFHAAGVSAQTCGPTELLTDPEGDWDGTFGGVGLPEQDVLGLTLEQTTAASGEILLTFRIPTAAAPATVTPPNAAWFASFETPEGKIYGVRLQTDPAGVESFFSYIARASNAGNIDGRFVETGSQRPAEAGEFGADGVVITVKASNIGISGPGQILGPFNAASVQSIPAGIIAATVDEAPEGLGRDGFFDIKHGCSGKSADLGMSAGAVPVSLLLPLLIALGFRVRRR